MSSQSPKIRSKWWYTLPIFLGIIGGVIAWFALKSHDKRLAKNCLTLGIIFNIIEISIFTSVLMFSDNLNIITESGTNSGANDFGFQFELNTP